MIQKDSGGILTSYLCDEIYVSKAGMVQPFRLPINAAAITSLVRSLSVDSTLTVVEALNFDDY